MAKANLKAVLETQQATSDNPLVAPGRVNISLADMHAYAEYLCECLARDEDEPSDNVQHGRYFAMRVLAGALEAVRQEEGGAA